MSLITSIHAIEILDSRGNPTVQARVTLEDGTSASAAVPSGASKGTHEAIELRDGDPKRYLGQGVLKAIDHIHASIQPALMGKDAADQQTIDRIMLDLDGTENKAHLGANALLAVSLACCRVAALDQLLPLYTYISSLRATVGSAAIPNEIASPSARNDKKFPIPMLNILNGGLHADGNVDFQEFMLIPGKEIGYVEGLRLGSELYHSLKKILKDKNLNTAVGDEGGFAPALSSNREALQLLKQAIEQSSYQYGKDVSLGLDLASSSFYREEKYHIKDTPEPLDASSFIEYLMTLQQEFQLVSLEDPLMEDDWDGWKQLTQRMGRDATSNVAVSTGQSVRIVGDDLLVTNPKRLQRAIAETSCNSILVKVNQIGTLTETLQVIAMAKAAGFSVIISHRSGETPDDFIADLAVGVAADYVKLGAPARGERVAKYNRLLEIYDDLHKA